LGTSGACERKADSPAQQKPKSASSTVSLKVLLPSASMRAGRLGWTKASW
jgi:hypothetical protein